MKALAVTAIVLPGLATAALWANLDQAPSASVAAYVPVQGQAGATSISTAGASGPAWSGAATTPRALAAAAAPSGYSLAFADEFDGTALDRSRWYYRITPGKYREGYMRAENVSVANGALRLRYAKEALPGISGDQYTGGGIISRARFGYGYYETRARLFDAAAGLHTSFWSMGLRQGDPGAAGDSEIDADIAAGLLPEHGQIHEIDGFEHDSATRLDQGTQKQATTTVIRRVGGRTAAQIGIDFAAWNTYAWELTPTVTRFLINGVVQLEVPTASYPSPFAPQNVWLTALPFSPNTDVTPLPGYSEFDYVRFYRNDGLIGVNLLANGDFDVTPVTAPPTWLVPGWQENYDKPASFIITAGTHSGGRALRQGLATTYTVTDKQDLKYIPNGTYRLTAWVKSSGGQSTAQMRVLNHGSAEISQAIGAQAGWTQIALNGIVVTSGNATIAFTSIGSGGQTLDIDDVVFERVS